MSSLAVALSQRARRQYKNKQQIKYILENYKKSNSHKSYTMEQISMKKQICGKKIKYLFRCCNV